MVERNGVGKTKLYIVFHDVGVAGVGNLLGTFLSPSNLEGETVNQKVGNRLFPHICFHRKLIEEK